jgi:hypothetical protein
VLLQHTLRVLRFGFFPDADVGIGVFPQGEEIFVRGLRFLGVALQSMSVT